MAPRDIFCLPSGGQHHQERCFKPGLLTYALRKLKSVHAGHVTVEKRNRYRFASRLSPSNLREDGRTTVCQDGPHAPALEHALENSAVRGIIVHNQHGNSSKHLRRWKRRFAFPIVTHLEPDREMKRASLPRLAFNPDPSAHEMDQLSRDGKPETCSPILSRCGTIGLREGLKDLGVHLLRDAHSCITHRKLEFHFFRADGVASDADDDLAGFRKLDAVPNQVDDDLPEPGGVSHEFLRDFGRDIERKFQALLVGAYRERLQGVPEDLAE